MPSDGLVPFGAHSRQFPGTVPVLRQHRKNIEKTSKKHRVTRNVNKTETRENKNLVKTVKP